jgi:hypothetical protein
MLAVGARIDVLRERSGAGRECHGRHERKYCFDRHMPSPVLAIAFFCSGCPDWAASVK